MVMKMSTYNLYYEYLCYSRKVWTPNYTALHSIDARGGGGVIYIIYCSQGQRGHSHDIHATQMSPFAFPLAD